MRRVIFLLVLVIVLMIAALSIGLGWYLLIPEKISEIVGGPQKQVNAPEASVPSLPVVSPEAANNVRLKIGEQAGYKMKGFSQVNVNVTNLDNFAGDAKLFAVLYYAQKPVANATILVSFQPRQSVIEKIAINTTGQWNAFEVRQI